MPASLWEGAQPAEQLKACSRRLEPGRAVLGPWLLHKEPVWRLEETGTANTKRCFIHNDIQVGNRRFVDLPLEGFFVSTGSGPGSGKAMRHRVERN